MVRHRCKLPGATDPRIEKIPAEGGSPLPAQAFPACYAALSMQVNCPTASRCQYWETSPRSRARYPRQVPRLGKLYSTARLRSRAFTITIAELVRAVHVCIYKPSRHGFGLCWAAVITRKALHSKRELWQNGTCWGCDCTGVGAG